MPFDFAAVSAPFRMQPGLRKLADGAPQLTPNELQSTELREKLGVLSHHASHALLATPGFDAAPALATLMQQAVREHPASFAWDGDAAFEARALGWSLRSDAVLGDGPSEIGDCLRALPAAWRLPGLLSLALAEDFAIIDGTTARIPWLAVCLPSRWAPEDKLGLHFAEVHAPVADNRVLITASDHLARLVTGGERWERFVWTITPDKRLGQHPKHMARVAWPAAQRPADVAAGAFFRTEQQTFIPLPDRAQAIFTIRVESRPLIDAIDSASRARQLYDALASMSPAVLDYRGLADARDGLLEWLIEHASAAAS